MSHFEPPAIARPKIRTIVVPSSLYAAMVRANLNLMDLTVFGKLRKIASLEQIAVYAALNDTTVIAGSKLATSSLREILSLGDGSGAEMDGVLDRMMHTQEIRELAKSALEDLPPAFASQLALKLNPGAAKPVKDTSMKNTLGGPLAADGDLPYQLKTSGSNVFVVVGPGFDKYVGATQDKKESRAFVRDFLELCDELFSSGEVARHPLFKTFLYSLAV